NALEGGEYDKDLLIDIYKDYGVSPHYLINREGRIYRLVEDKNIAYHAGVSKMPDGRKNANGFSIGVELINNKEDKYTKSQYSALNDLLDYLGEKYKIKYTLGHDEISPDRKTDPWNMDWDKVDR
ncbi:N-acetylmuramoyl-L-alanine amidase, partial [Patescibacteria group bacterium]